MYFHDLNSYRLGRQNWLSAWISSFWTFLLWPKISNSLQIFKNYQTIPKFCPNCPKNIQIAPKISKSPHFYHFPPYLPKLPIFKSFCPKIFEQFLNFDLFPLILSFSKSAFEITPELLHFHHFSLISKFWSIFILSQLCPRWPILLFNEYIIHSRVYALVLSISFNLIISFKFIQFYSFYHFFCSNPLKFFHKIQPQTPNYHAQTYVITYWIPSQSLYFSLTISDQL